MTYTALSLRGPRIALAMSEDLFHWERIGLATFAAYRRHRFCSMWTIRTPASSPSPFQITPEKCNWPCSIAHFFPALVPRKPPARVRCRWVDPDHESIWISYCPMPPENLEPHRPGLFNSHHRLATPVSPWERLKIGGGTPPILTRHGWLILYHGVSKLAEPGKKDASYATPPG